jgi:4-hydroxybenzoate polyprenyltransferase
MPQPSRGVSQNRIIGSFTAPDDVSSRESAPQVGRLPAHVQERSALRGPRQRKAPPGRLGRSPGFLCAGDARDRGRAAHYRSAMSGVPTTSVSTARLAPAPSIAARARLVGADIKLAHSVFAMPFAVLAAFMAGLAEQPAPVAAATLALVVVCMVAARTWAMLVNRLADLPFDRENPRTSRRVFASGRLGARDGVVAAAVAATVFLTGCAGFWLVNGNAWPLLLGAPVLGWIALYSFTKRFTWLCHLFLGGALAASPLAAALAVRPVSLAPPEGLAIWLLAGMVALWVAGFDVLYALQDVAFDRTHNLRSVPARFGRRGAMSISRGLHAGALACLIGVWRADPRFGATMAAGVALVAGLLVLEHAIVARKGDLELAFFTVNGVVSVLLGVVGVVDVVA